MARRRLIAGFGATLLVLGGVAGFGPVVSASAAVSPDEQWITSVSGGGTAAGDITFGSSGVTATLSATAGRCGTSPNQTSYVNLTSRLAQNYFSPDAPTTAVGIEECLNDNAVGTRTVVLNKPIAGLVFHLNNLDASYLDFQAASGGDPVALTVVQKNVSIQLQQSGTRLFNSVVQGTANCTDNATATNNPACGSFRVAEGGGPVDRFTMVNSSRSETTSRDGWYWSLSFHTGSLTKSFSPAVIPAGEESTLTFTVTNPNSEGAVPFDGVDFSDALPSGLVLANSTVTTTGCGPAAVNGGAPSAGQSAVNVTGASIAAGGVCTVAVEVTSQTPGSYVNNSGNLTASLGNIVPNADTMLQVVPAVPALSLQKTAVLSTDSNADGLADAGDQITYSFLVANTGNVPIENVAIIDPRISGTTPASVDLAVDAETTFVSEPYVVSAADVSSGSVVNTAIARGLDDSDEVDSTESTATVPVPSIPGLSLEKSAVLADENDNGFADVGETIQYSFLVRNVGNVPVENVSVEDDRITGTTPASVTLQLLSQQLFVADPYIVTQGDVDAGGITNVAFAAGATTGGIPVTSPEDSEYVQTVLRAPALSLDKTAELNDANGNGVADLGETIDYTFEVENTGNVTIEAVEIVDPLVTGITPSTVDLAPGGTASFSAAPYIVVQADLNVGSITNTAVAAATAPTGPVQSNTDSTVTPTPTPNARIVLDKTGVITGDTDGDGRADAGDTVTYTFLVTNTGTVDVDAVSIEDARVANVAPAAQDLPAGESRSFTAVYTATQADVDFGSIPNTASAKGEYATSDGGPVVVRSAPDTHIVPTPDRAPALTINKTGEIDDANGNGLADVGETIAYSFLVTNTGNTTLANVAVLDDRVSGFSPADTTLAANGGTQLFSVEPYTVTQQDVDAGQVLNSATARGTVPGGAEVGSLPDDETHPTPTTAAMTLQKSAMLQDDNGNGTADTGESITYTFRVSNTGAVTLADVTVLDDRITALLPEQVDFLIPAATATFTAEPYRVTPVDVNNGEIVNTATATGTAPGGELIESAEDSAIIATTPPPAPPSEPEVVPVPDPGPSTSPSVATELPSTGADVSGGIVAALVLFILGACAVIWRRRATVL